MNIDSLVTVIVSVISSGGIWTFLQFVIGRRSEAARQHAETQNKRDERSKMLAEAQAVAQETALRSTGKALDAVTRQCDKCLDELGELREATGQLIDTFEAYMDDESPGNRRLVRVSIQAMRRVL